MKLIDRFRANVELHALAQPTEVGQRYMRGMLWAGAAEVLRLIQGEVEVLEYQEIVDEAYKHARAMTGDDQ